MKLSIAGVSVMLAMPTHRDLPPETVGSLLDTQAACIEYGVPLQVYFGKGSSLVHHSRSKIAWQFLQTSFNRIFWIDSDQAWRADAFLRLLALSTVKDVVCAAYPHRRDPPGFFLTPLGAEVEADEHGCIAVKELGLGFACVQRHVVEELAAKAPSARFSDVNDGQPIPHIFRMGIRDGFAVGEDCAFFEDVRGLGYSVHVDPTITLGHIGPKVFSGSLAGFLGRPA